MTATVNSFDEASKFAPLKDSDSFTLAMAYVNSGHDARARVLLEALAVKYPDHAIYRYWLGRLDYDQRRYDEAGAQLVSAAKLDPNSARIWDSLGLTYDMQGKLDQAHAAFDKAVGLNRKQSIPSPWPPHDLGYLLLRLEEFDAAEKVLREAIGYDPKLAQAHYHLGRVLEKQGRDTEAIREYSTAISDDPAADDACYSLGMLYRKLKRENDAAAAFSEYRKRREASSVRPPDPGRN